jgi:hypothetical protein
MKKRRGDLSSVKIGGYLGGKIDACYDIGSF